MGSVFIYCYDTLHVHCGAIENLLVNASVGKSWYIKRNYQLGFSLQVKNILNNTDVRTGGYEQTRLVDKTVSKERYYRFDSKYFYMSGINYMLNIYFRF